MVIIQGYQLQSTDVNEVEQILLEMQHIVKQRVTEHYHELLSREIEQLVDHIALNIQPRPEQVSLLDAAREVLNRKVSYATAMQNETPYNLYVSVNVLFHDDSTYFKFNANNDLYRKLLGQIKGLKRCHLEDGSLPETEELWKFLMEKYSNGVAPMGVQLSPFGEIGLNTKALHFKSPAARAKIIARHNLTNRYLRMFAEDREIPNFKLMEFLDEALTLLTDTKRGKEELSLIQEDLIRKNLLPNITIALIERDPSKENKIRTFEQERQADAGALAELDDQPITAQ